MEVMFVTFCVKSFFMLGDSPHISKLMLKQSLVWYYSVS